MVPEAPTVGYGQLEYEVRMTSDMKRGLLNIKGGLQIFVAPYDYDYYFHCLYYGASLMFIGL